MDGDEPTPNLPTPLDAVEMTHAMAGMASVWMSLFRALVDEGASETVALQLTSAYVHGMAGGKLS